MIMQNEITQILKKQFSNSNNIEKARKEICILLHIKRSDDPICPACGSDDLSSLGNYTDENLMTGTEYRCDECYNEFDFDDYK